MHEWSIADGIVAAVLEQAASRNAARVKEVEVLVGELRDLDIQVLEEAIGQLSRATVADGAIFQFRRSHALFKCSLCGENWNMKKATEMIASQLSEKGYVVEAEELELPTHFMPMLVVGLQRCPKCGGMDIEVEGGHELMITRIVLEAGSD
ncbi:MAG: hydrogenase/urease maturation nickel metallochaperone HypA [Nitrososphaerota archaeon]